MDMLIAEFGNNHLGDINKAKEYIRIAKDCGATHAKGQAFHPKDITSGSMPYSFYQKCALDYYDYVELIDYGKQIGIDVFFSIFTQQYEPLAYHQNWYKIAGNQVKLGFKDIKKKDTDRTIVSIPEFSIMPDIKKSHILFVTPYMCKEPNYGAFQLIENYYEKPIGLSCHCIGIEQSLKYIREYNIPILEKHFTLERDIKYKNQVFRDSIHACLPNELEKLAKELS